MHIPPPPLRARTPQRIHAPAQTWVAAILNAMRPYTPPPPAGADPTANTRTCTDVGGGHFECDETLHPPPPPAGADPTANTRTCTDVGGGHFECDATLHLPPLRGRGPHSKYTHLHRRGWRPF